ncbi:MAG: oligopeptide transporter, OPT family [Planctomycetota bacterium]|nr:MAG: oligopeptide transporter, OPT family [Planctomycetota bacterium]
MTGEQIPGGAATPPHKPYVPAESLVPEIGLAPVAIGAILGIIFGASSLYLVLKVGMTVSASIPIAVLSITLFRVIKPIIGRNATILENNIVQTTGSAGESIAFGVGVTMPALLILGYNLEVLRVMLVAVLGGLLGVLMMIPLRRVFIVKQHGRLVYPEGVACADVLIVGEKGGSSAATVFGGFGLAFIYQFMMMTLKMWKDVPSRMLHFFRGDGSTLFSFKGAAVALEATPTLLGVGYVIGPRIACIMVGGGIMASWVLLPLIIQFGEHINEPVYPGAVPISQMKLKDVFDNYVLYIGAGAVAAGGIISMIQSLPTIFGSIKAGLGDLASKGRGGAASASRLDRDISMKIVIVGCLALVIAIYLAPMLNVDHPLEALMIVFFGFLFVTVSARLTGEIGSSSNPISGMTVATLLLTCLIFVAVGWTGPSYRLTALSIAAIVCIACSNGGTVAQCLKTGYIVGATPRHQQVSILVGALTSALVIGVTLLLLNDSSTVYSKNNLPTDRIDVSTLDAKSKERVMGHYAANDTNEYLVLQARVGQLPGVLPGKYLVDEQGKICYLADPGINGKLESHDDGTKVTKYNAPKAALMSFIVDGILTQNLPWDLVLLGVSISIVLELAGIPSLPFAVGVYLPLYASTPIFVGGMVRFFADKIAKRSAAESEMSPGVLLSSGYIAGGSIAGIICAVFAAFATDLSKKIELGERVFGEAASSNWLPLIPFGILVVTLLLVGMTKNHESAKA